MKIGVIILCRSSSRRLPNKMHKKIDGKAALLHTVDQARMLFSDDNIVVATSDDFTDDSIENLCISNKINCFRGSLTNVAERFSSCAQEHKFDYAIRLNGDNIFVNRKLMKTMIDVARVGEIAFLSNVKGRTYPKGLSIEIIKTEKMANHMSQINKSVEYREHVLYYFYENSNLTKKFFYNESKKNIDKISFALDTSEDLERIKSTIKQLGPKYPNYTYQDIIEAHEHLDRQTRTDTNS